MPLRKKILASMIVPALLIFTVGVAGIISLRYLKQAAGRILSHNYHTIEEARKMEQMLRMAEASLFQAIHLHDTLSDSINLQFDRSLIRCEKNITETGEKEVLAGIRENWKTVRRMFSQNNASENKIDSGTLYLAAVTNELYRDIDSLISINEKAMFQYEAQTRKTADITLWGVLAALLLAIGTMTFFALVSAKRISEPIVEVSSRLHHALNPSECLTDKDSRSVDEIGVLKDELDKLLGRLSRYEDEQQKRLLHMQSRLAFVINEVLEGLVLIDDNRTIVAVNRVARKILGIQGGEGGRLDEISPREDVRLMLQPIINGTFQPERDLGEIRFSIGDEERIYRPRVLTVSSKPEHIEGFLLLFWDVTEQRRFEESRRKFISMLSHQLKTPMTSLSMSVNLLKEKLKAVDPSQMELLSMASEDCSSLASLISDLIEAAREPVPDLSLRFYNVNIVKLLRTGLRSFNAQAAEKGITLIIPPETDVRAWVDPVKFPWVITNITGNALRYTPAGGTVEIAVTPRDDGFTVDISDTGTGIPQEDLAYIFEPYISLDHEPEHGTHGLGLAIAKEIVEAHRGIIAVESGVGNGTRFHITVPFDAREVS